MRTLTYAVVDARLAASHGQLSIVGVLTPDICATSLSTSSLIAV
jgi:hypothetical protein